MNKLLSLYPYVSSAIFMPCGCLLRWRFSKATPGFFCLPSERLFFSPIWYRPIGSAERRKHEEMACTC